MKKILPILVVGILVLSGLGAIAFPEEEEFNHEKISVIFSKPIIETENNFISLNIEEANACYMEYNKPILPSYTHTFTFPFGTKIKDVTCELSNFQDIILDQYIMPTPICYPVSQNIVNKINEEETIDYGVDPYPAKNFDYDLGCGRYKDGLTVFVTIEVIPIIYYPDENKIEWAKNAKITVEYDPPNEPIIFDDEYEFIVLAPEEYSDELSSFISHKISRGITTKYVSLDDIYDEVYFPATGRDNQEMIKYFIKNAMENWGTHSVLLVGGSSKFPIRESHIYVILNEESMVFVSDLYYADIYNETGDFCSWDSNGNDVFAEFNWGPQHNFDELDLYPDVFIGRLACVSSNELNTCINKIKKYENDAAYSQDWFQDGIFIGGETWPDDSQGIREGEYIQSKVEDTLPDIDWDKVWESNGRLGKTSFPYGSGEITNAIKEGGGFLHWSGHGNLDVWASHRYKSHEWIPTPLGNYKNSNVKILSNGDELPITVIGACLVGKFNQDPDCFTWSHMLNSNGGAIACMSATESLYSDDGTGTANSMGGLIEISSFKSYSEEGALTFGEMWAWALKLYIDKRKPKLTNTYRYDYVTIEEWQAFGDPTLAIAPESQPPLKPDRPSGTTSGVTGQEYTYFSKASDPDGDEIYYIFDWADGTDSGWQGPIEEGTQFSASHTWNAKSTYNVKVQVRDIHGDLSEWSDPLTVKIPRNRVAENNIFNSLFERFENILPVLKIVLRLLIQ